MRIWKILNSYTSLKEMKNGENSYGKHVEQSLSNLKFPCICVLVTQSCMTLCDHMDYNPLGSSVHGILQAEYWNRLPFPSPGDLPNPGVKPGSSALQADSLQIIFFSTDQF